MAFEYSFRRLSSCEDLHDDEVVTLDTELATDSSVSDLENLFMNSYSFQKHIYINCI